MEYPTVTTTDVRYRIRWSSDRSDVDKFASKYQDPMDFFRQQVVPTSYTQEFRVS